MKSYFVITTSSRIISHNAHHGTEEFVFHLTDDQLAAVVQQALPFARLLGGNRDSVLVECDLPPDKLLDRTGLDRSGLEGIRIDRFNERAPVGNLIESMTNREELLHQQRLRGIERLKDQLEEK